MKKIRIELKPSVLGKAFRYFESPEALYFWLNDNAPGPDPVGSSVITLLPEEFLEVEWRGCEYVYENENINKPRRLDCVRFAKGSPTKNSAGLMVSVHYGWVSSDTFVFKNTDDELTNTTLLTSEPEWKLDLGKLFQDDAAASPDEETEDNR